MAELGLIVDGSVLIDGHRIDEVGSTRRIENLSKVRNARLLDVSGKVVTPGFVDSHTRLLSLPSPRTVAKSLDGRIPARYLAAASGAAAGASLRTQRARARAWTYRLAASGTTTIEIRLGAEASGRDPAQALRAILSVNQDPIQVAGAIGVRGESLEPGPIRVIEEILQVATRSGRKPLAYACEIETASGPWAPEVCQAIREMCGAAGVDLKVVAPAGVGIDAARRAVCLGARTLEGFGADWNDQRQADMLADSMLVATLIPGSTSRGARARNPIGRSLIDRGAAVCLATGFGGADRGTLSMAWAMGVACRDMGLTAAEAFTAATINGAAAMGLSGSVGSLEPGKDADLAVFDVADYREIPYFLGANMCVTTIKSGRVIYHLGPLPSPRPRKSP